jgi:hypothetical protein
MFKVFGVALVVIAVAIAVVPMFTDCQSQGKQIALANGKQIPMKCHWTGIAEAATAIPLALVGGMMVASRRKQSLTYLSILGIALGGVAIALPSGMIGVCQTPTMTCVTAMKPALLSLGGLAAGISVVGMVLSRRAKGLS